MNSGVVQLLVLAAVAIFLILKLKNVLGTRDGFEKPALRDDPPAARAERRGADLSVVEGGLDRDIVDHVKAGSPAADALARMKAAEPSFTVVEFLSGAKGAYEMIVMAFERGDMESIRPFLAPEVDATFTAAVEDRKAKGLTIEASFHGLREMEVTDAEYDPATRMAEVTVRFVGELSSVVRDAKGEIIDGNKEEIRRQRDVWTFSRVMGSGNPNWTLTATGE
ncbi:Tim44/TimA family putative adaptor protein [Frigidibacter sp. ROC022]|uniref:Tim44/TimA family putative adaptor protein n=1 Tax=Frigidibacter sp. ROC022 TaxID=2971796 RepID=UPI00215AD2B5|nr:Tim44/TimA family putative adaptor protein [Frigidibacter sp. ROC022]MCR8724480.1 Tim44/TimA family putative adaptor protein [Frigidibacter sp. ROC022]